MKNRFRVKDGVVLSGLNPTIKMALYNISYIYQEYGYEMVVTSAREGVHKKGSLHYQGLAADIRTRHIDSNDLGDIVKDIEKYLTAIDKRFQIVLEDTHLHIEFDRRWITQEQAL